MWFIIFGLLVVVGLIYYYLTSNYRFFEKRGVPGPKPKFPFGNMPSWVTQKQSVTFDYDDIYQWILQSVVKSQIWIQSFCREFRGKAPFVGYFEARSPSILLIDPETIKCVLVKNFTNFHDNTFSQMVRLFEFHNLAIFTYLKNVISAIKNRSQSSVETRSCCAAKNGKKSVPR